MELKRAEEVLYKVLKKEWDFDIEFKYEGDLRVPTFTISMEHLKAFAFSCGEEFECYYNDELYYFYPTTNKQQCAKWALLVDEIVKGQEEDEQQ